jgi:hypothetical protein
MSSFGATIRKRLRQLYDAGANVPKIIDEVAEGATIEAVRIATENTPPNGVDISGTNTRSGNMAQHWTTDSETTPNHGLTVLANNMQYASYVNDGHRMDRHFVPGLINNNGVLERVHKDEGGIMVGVRTTYVRGRYMKEKAINKWRSVVRKELDKRVREEFKK